MFNKKKIKLLMDRILELEERIKRQEEEIAYITQKPRYFNQ